MKLLFLWTSVAHSDTQPVQPQAAQRTEEGQAGGREPGGGVIGPSLIEKMALGPRRLFLPQNENSEGETGGRGHASSEALIFCGPRLPRWQKTAFLIPPAPLQKEA